MGGSSRAFFSIARNPSRGKERAALGAGRSMDSPILRLLPRHHHKPAVAGVVIAGGQGQELVAVFRGDPYVVQGRGLLCFITSSCIYGF